MGADTVVQAGRKGAGVSLSFPPFLFPLPLLLLPRLDFEDFVEDLLVRLAG